MSTLEEFQAAKAVAEKEIADILTALSRMYGCEINMQVSTTGHQTLGVPGHTFTYEVQLRATF